MTTRIHIVNLGPSVVEAETSTTAPSTKLYHGDSVNFYVYEGQEVIVREVKLATIESPQSLSKA